MTFHFLIPAEFYFMNFIVFFVFSSKYSILLFVMHIFCIRVYR
jgi:hypothetical protein